jgi:hypothetical protein
MLRELQEKQAAKELQKSLFDDKEFTQESNAQSFIQDSS